MSSSGLLGRVVPLRTDDTEEHIASIIKVTRIGELDRASVVSSSPILVTLMKKALSSSGKSVHIKATRLHNQEEDTLYGHSRENQPPVL
jgi:hypothetical protein